MRQQHHQKNNRSRGRGRKQQNPMSRNFESNGPDVKIRGNAAHIAEKYTTLARDCLSNGDRVVAENYLQHAEHYNRIVAAAQAQNPQPNRNDNQDNDNNSNEDTAEAKGQQSEANSPDQNRSQNDGGDKPNRKNSNGKQNNQRAAKSDDSESENNAANTADANEAVTETASESDDDKPVKKERKTTRARRPRKNSEANGDDAPKTKPEKVVAEPEVISDDAAKLPDSIMGGMFAEES